MQQDDASNGPGVAGPAHSAPDGGVADPTGASDTRPSPDTYRGKHVDSDAENESLDPLALVRGVLASRIREPKVLAGLVALAVLVAYLLGRASGRRGG